MEQMDVAALGEQQVARAVVGTVVQHEEAVDAEPAIVGEQPG